MFQFLERALAINEEARLCVAQRVWLAWIRPWRYRAKYYESLRTQGNSSDPVANAILRRLTAGSGGNPPDDVYTVEYQTFVRENIDCYSTLLHVWMERVAQVQFPVHLDTGGKAQVCLARERCAD